MSITLTSRGDGVPLAGVPVKAAADYLRQLIAAGHRVAICEQVEDPRLAKGIVRREVVETITPGAILDESTLPGSRNNYLASVSGQAGHDARSVGVAAIDLSTGEFLLETVPTRFTRRYARPHRTKLKSSCRRTGELALRTTACSARRASAGSSILSSRAKSWRVASS